jgi:hypothetical protein
MSFVSQSNYMLQLKLNYYTMEILQGLVTTMESLMDKIKPGVKAANWTVNVPTHSEVSTSAMNCEFVFHINKSEN